VGTPLTEWSALWPPALPADTAEFAVAPGLLLWRLPEEGKADFYFRVCAVMKALRLDTVRRGARST
jgi:hypothetical protein